MKKALIVAAALLVFVQFIPVKRTNPPVTSNITAEPRVKALLKRSCYDCHSNETVWPGYSRIAPISWLVAHHVNEGRQKVNFSEWDRISPEKAQELISESVEEVEEGEMPMKIYTLLHPAAAPNAREIKMLQDWAESRSTEEMLEKDKTEDEEDAED